MWRRTTAERKAGLRASGADTVSIADLNVARNVLAAAHAVLACGEPVPSDRSAGIRRTSGQRRLAGISGLQAGENVTALIVER